MPDYSDADFVDCLRAARATEAEYCLAESIDSSSTPCALTPAHFSALLSPVVNGKHQVLSNSHVSVSVRVLPTSQGRF